MTKLVTLASALLATATLACTPNTPKIQDIGVVSAPALGIQGGQDGADRGCHVVLRSVSRVRAGGGYETHCVPNGPCWYVWEGVLSLSADAVAQGGTPAVLFQVGVDPTWWRVAAEPMEGPAGEHRYRFRIQENTVPDGMSMTSLMRTRLELAPVVELPDGSRLFDHNRNPGDFDNYTLDADNQWAIAEDYALCATSSQRSGLQFRRDWTQHQHGALVAGGRVLVDYDLQRLPQCMGSSYMGVPDWSTVAHARFLPGGETVSGLVSQVSYAGGADPQVVPVPWELDIPAGANRVELWFVASGRSCAAQYDSNFGANFAFPVQAVSVDSQVGWAGDGGAVISRGMCGSARTAGVPSTVVVDSWIMTRAECLWVDMDVYVPGVTDQAAAHPEWVQAQVRFQRDGGAPATRWLEFVERVGNNDRYRWRVRDDLDLMYVPWDRIEYTFQFSVDGNDWYTVSPEGADTYLLERDDSWCPAYYWPEHCAE